MKYWILPFIIFLTAVAGPYSLIAFNRQDLQRLLKTNRCMNCDLSRANLEYVNLKGALLTGANLERAVLSNAYLAGANLQFANLFWANLKKARIRDADFRNSYLLKATFNASGFPGTVFEGATWVDRHICKKGSIGKCIY